MTILEHTPSADDILDVINDGIRQIQAAGAEPRYVVMGTSAFDRFKQAMAARLQREAKNFELYNYIPVVVDPFRTDAVCVLPSPGEIAKGVAPYRLSE